MSEFKLTTEGIRYIALFVEPETVAEAWFVSQMADTLIFGHLAIEIIERFLISHFSVL